MPDPGGQTQAQRPRDGAGRERCRLGRAAGATSQVGVSPLPPPEEISEPRAAGGERQALSGRHREEAVGPVPAG